MNQTINTWLLVIYSLLLTGCSNAAINIQFQPSAWLNPDQRKQSLPVMVKLYQLRDDNTFSQATFWELWKNDQITLGHSLIGRREITIAPNMPVEVRLARHSDAYYLGIIAIFRRPKNQDWRIVSKLPVVRVLVPIHLKIKLVGEKISIM